MNTSIKSNAPWLQSDSLKAVISALDHEARIVGGAVRDSLLNLDVADIDLATPLLPDDVVLRLEHAGIKAIPTGIEHGTITAVSNGQTYEITTLRRDVSTDGRRATVAFSNDWIEDAARRDFTINALYADPESGEVFDYFEGLADLAVPKVRFIGNANSRIAEDHLRILRFFRFHARFGAGEADDEAIAACSTAAKSLMALSRERIADEIMKLLALPAPSASIGLMLDNGIFAAFMPEVCAANFDRLLNREHEAGIEPSPGRRLNALLPNDPVIVDVVAARLKLSNKARVELTQRLANQQPQTNEARALAYEYGLNIAHDIMLLHGCNDDWQTGINALHEWEVPAFPIKGGELVKRGLFAGPLVAKTLKAIERQWIEEGFPNEIRANEIADQLVAEALSNKN
jgi:poly(A) polymerase